MSRRPRTATSESKAFAQAGTIRIRGMRFWGKHGANPGEQRRDQPIDVDVSVRLASDEAARSDALTDTFDYDQIFRVCEEIVTRRSFALLEALAQAIADALWQRQPLRSLSVRVRKPRLLAGATPEVELTRRRRLP